MQVLRRDGFETVISTHLLDGTDHHQFRFDIVRCSTDTATNLRVGVCSADGRKHWVLRLADARLCDQSGQAIEGCQRLFERAQMPRRAQGVRVEIRCNMKARKLEFCLEGFGMETEGVFAEQVQVTQPTTQPTNQPTNQPLLLLSRCC